MLKHAVYSLVLVLALSFVSTVDAVALTFDDPCGSTYTIGPLVATGFGSTEKAAAAEAYADMADQIQMIQDALPPQDVILGVYSNAGTWDPPVYDIQFTIVVLVTCDE